MGDYAAKGREYVEKADKKLKGFSLFTSSSAKNEDAVELLERAATQFKLAQSCERTLAARPRMMCFPQPQSRKTDHLQSPWCS